MKERIEKLRRRAIQFDEPQQRQFFIELAELISDLIHKVEEFEPEEITEDDVNKYYREERKSLLQEGIERDKLAQKLVEAIFEWRDAPDLSPAKVVMLAEQLKEKFNATEQ